MNPNYTDVANRANYRCEYCLAPERAFGFRFEIEHIQPRSRSGTDDVLNLALACRACNLRKGDAVTAPDAETQCDVRLFHPRQDRWNDHFRFESRTYAIVGTTPIGRATIVRLGLNDAQRLIARRIWRRLQLYP